MDNNSYFQFDNDNKTMCKIVMVAYRLSLLMKWLVALPHKRYIWDIISHQGWILFYIIYNLKCFITFPWYMINAPATFVSCMINGPVAFAWCMNHVIHKVEFFVHRVEQSSPTVSMPSLYSVCVQCIIMWWLRELIYFVLLSSLNWKYELLSII